jgi:hypothetical protein
MKTQVIKLDSHDDVSSVRDKMSWAKTERILLVFPRHSRILERALDLHLLQRHAATLGSQLAIVSRSYDQRLSAEELKIPAFGRIASAQRKSWDRENGSTIPTRRHERPDLEKLRQDAFPPEAAWRSLFGIRFTFFTLGVLAILAVFSLFIPSASILVNPATSLQNLSLSISASRSVTTFNVASSLPARVNSAIVENSKTAPVTGTVAIPQGQAQGMARFRNLTIDLTGIPTGTVITTQTAPPIRFATTEDAVVAAGFGKTVDVPIQALKPGSTGNLPADTLIVFEGGLGTSLAVINPDPTTGGSDKTASIQTASDRSHLREALLDDILEECKSSIQDNLIPGDIYFPDTLAVSQVLSETYFPPEGQSGDILSLTLRLQCQAQYAAQSDVTNLAQVSLEVNRPEGFVPAQGSPTTLSATIPLTGADGVTHWSMQFQQLLRAQVDTTSAVQLSIGRKPVDAVFKLKASLPLAESPIIHIQPGWWPWMPVVPFRITVSTID